MYKKAGIVVAASAAALLALTPVAFATGIDKSAEGFFAGGNGNNISTPGTVCNNDGTVGAVGGAVKDATGAGSLAGSVVGDSKSKSFANDEDNRACTTESSAGDGH